MVVGSLAHSEQELHEGSGLKEYCTEVIAEVLPSSVRWLQACRALLTNRPSSVAYFGPLAFTVEFKQHSCKPTSMSFLSTALSLRNMLWIFRVDFGFSISGISIRPSGTLTPDGELCRIR